MTTSRSTFASKPRSLEATAFHDGAHGIDPRTGIEQIEARFNQELSEEKAEPGRKLHDLESRLQQARKERPEAEAVWQKVRKELGDTPPPYFHAVVMGIFAAFAQVIDTLFLAPTMDILNIASTFLQYLGAAGLAAISTGIFEFAFRKHADAKNETDRQRAVAIGGTGALGLIAWGLLRGRELQFAAGLSGNPLGDFLGSHPILATMFFIFITLATPMLGAAALLHGWIEFSGARTWRRIKGRFDELRSAEVDLARQVQAEAQHFEEIERRKTEQCREWKAIYSHYYDRGRRNGARQEPMWSVLMKTAGGALLATPLAFLIPAAWFPVQLALPIVPGIALFAYFSHRRHHPSYEWYLKQENTQFAETPDAPKSRELRAPQPRLLSKGDEKYDNS